MSTNFDNALFSNDWISQAEAARMRGVSRQAIAKLIKKGRITSLVIGGHVLVNRAEILHFEARPAGRPKNKEQNEPD